MYYYVGLVTGALLLIGTLVILGFGKHNLDPATNDISMKVPILGTIKTRSPLVFFACVGFTLVIVCSRMAPKEDSIVVDGQIDTVSPVTVYFVAIPKAQYHQQVSGPVHTSIPKVDNADYRAEFVVGDKLVDDKALTVVNGRASLGLFANSGSNSKTSQSLIPNVEVSDAAAQDFLK